MDCNMPIMDGFEATIRIRDMQELNQDYTQIIALTANANDSFRIRCLDCGMNDFLTKPVHINSIKKVLKTNSLIK